MVVGFVFFVASLVSVFDASVIKENADVCSPAQFRCGDGACVDGGRACDGAPDCADGSDEVACAGAGSLMSIMGQYPLIHRLKRQARSCGKYQWRCRDGSCISFDGKCDGVTNCADGSDEAHALCRTMTCQPNWFRCTYGACADGAAPCDGVRDCADGSDELLPRCRNATDDVGGKFRCADGSQIPSGDKCDGLADCPDSSDETVRACADVQCPEYLFQCAYGACVDQGSDCNGQLDCADGSDESSDLCNRSGDDATTGGTQTVGPSPTGRCVLPPNPEHGSYSVANVLSPRPGQAFDYVTLNVTCAPGYGVEGSSVVFCQQGSWSAAVPKCVRYCKLAQRPGVEYRCVIPNSQGGTRACETFEPAGTLVVPSCVKPNYYSPTDLPIIRCIDGTWDHTPDCRPECGRVTPEGEQLAIGGVSAAHGELPWHAGVYRKDTRPYRQICGGSIVSDTLVISAAHCFWDDLTKKQPPSLYAVAAGKIYRPWNEPHDPYAQKSDVSNILIPERFLGAETNFQDDVALVFLSQRFTFRTYLRPVCIDFDVVFENSQLTAGHSGKVAGWGLTAANGNASQVLKVVDLPFVPIGECYARAPPGYREHITSDKICAGSETQALCKGDSGGGLAFSSAERSIERFYLRGVVSTAPKNFDLCNSKAITSFTQIIKHETFIKPYLTI